MDPASDPSSLPIPSLLAQGAKARGGFSLGAYAPEEHSILPFTAPQAAGPQAVNPLSIVKFRLQY